LERLLLNTAGWTQDNAPASLYVKVDPKTMMQARTILEQAWTGAEQLPPERLREVI
jgi:hypothetical protein